MSDYKILCVALDEEFTFRIYYNSVITSTYRSKRSIPLNGMKTISTIESLVNNAHTDVGGLDAIYICNNVYPSHYRFSLHQSITRSLMAWAFRQNRMMHYIHVSHIKGYILQDELASDEELRTKVYQRENINNKDLSASHLYADSLLYYVKDKESLNWQHTINFKENDS